jgi:hypothetical protein
MAAEFIDDTENGSGLYPTKIPGYEDAADIQEALRLYHYGSDIIPTVDSLTDPNGINSKSIAGYLKELKNTDISNAALAATNLSTETTNRTNADTNLQTQINNISSTLSLQTSITTKTDSFTLQLADAGKTILLASSVVGSPIPGDPNPPITMTLTIPNNSSAEIPVGYQYNLIQLNYGRTIFTSGSGVTVNSKNGQMWIDTQYGKATLLKIGTDEWVLFGDIYENVAEIPYSFTPYSFTPTPGYSFTPYSFTPYSFTPYSFTPEGYSFTPFSFTPPEYSFTPYSFTPYSFTPFSFTPPAQTGTAYISYCLNGVATQDTFTVDENNLVVTDINQACATYNSLLSGLGATSINCSITSMPALPDCSTTYSFTPYSFTPYSFTPYSFTPFSFTPPAVDCNDRQTLGQGDCAGCGLVWSPIFGECIEPEAPYSFTPFSFTPPEYSFTPYSFTPYSFTPYSFTPFSFTPSPIDCNSGALTQGDCAGCGLVWSPIFGECIEPEAPYSFTPAGYSFTPEYSFTPTPYSFTPEYSFTPYSFTPAETYSFVPFSFVPNPGEDPGPI